ncbi:MAG: hypothetical protein R2751_07005 [Bacteroidales bacterium]
MDFFNYTFYRVCDFYKRKRDSAAEMTGAVIVSVLYSFIIIDAFILLRVFWEFPIPERFNKFWFLPVYLIIVFFNWLVYVKPRRYRDFRSIYKEEAWNDRKANGWKIVLAISISILIPIVYGLIRHNIMGGQGFLE